MNVASKKAEDDAALGAEIRRYLRALRSGTLSTLSQRLGGHPFGSLVPYVLDHKARPILLISKLAEHTRNICADSRVSLLATELAEDVQTGARVTLVGDAEALEAVELPAIRERYLRFFPKSRELLALGDFQFMAVRPGTLRFIGGFGRIHWISSEGYAPPLNQMASAEADIVAHMNADHSDNLMEYCRHYLKQVPHEVAMCGIDCDGVDLRLDGRLARIDFTQPITNSDEARTALVGMAQTARDH